MTSTTMELLLLVCLCLLSCSGDADRVVVEEDSDAVLPCFISPKKDLTGQVFDWKKGSEDVFIHYSDGSTTHGRDFTDRVSHFQDQLQNGDASIKIKKTKKTDSGTYSCIFPHLQSQTSIIELVVDQVLTSWGLAPEPVIKILEMTKDWALLQCEAHGVPRPTIKWENSENKTLPAEEPKISDRGDRFYITGKITVNKTDNYRCVATQETLSHQIAAVTSVYIQGLSAGVIAGYVVLSILLGVPAVLYIRHRVKKHHKKGSRPNTANGRTDTSERPSNLELLSDSDPAESIENHSAPV